MRSHLASLAMSGSTVVVGLNGALQKRFILAENAALVPGNVHRAMKVQTGIGGKGQDVAISLKCLNYEGNLKVAQFIGSGSTGDVLYGLLHDKLGEAAMDLTIRSTSVMRTCTSIVASDVTTELVEPSAVISTVELGDLMTKLSNLQPPPAALCIMGSMPPGCQDETYAKIYEQVATPTMICLVDSVIGTKSLLRSISNSKNAGPVLFKINASELCKLVGFAESKSETAAISRENLSEAITIFLENYSPSSQNSLKGIAITDGKHPAFFAALAEDEFLLYEIPIPALRGVNPLYPIGAGDAVAAGTIAAWRCLEGWSSGIALLPSDIEDALRKFLACGDWETPSSTMRNLMASFSFGLACGSASKSNQQLGITLFPDKP